jgi:GNAT superfamily N-acetyltransferase
LTITQIGYLIESRTTMIIRTAVFNDLEAILSLVQELARYEKAPDEVWVNIADYRQGFIEGIFEAIVAELDGEIAGTCVYYLTWSTWKGRMLYLEDFVVSEFHRRCGIGQALFDAFINRARELDCTLVKWQVLDWNTPALNFYRKNGALIEKDWWNGKIILKERP